MSIDGTSYIPVADRCYVYWIHLPEHTCLLLDGYIGITKNLSNRWSCHRKGHGTSYHLQNSIKKYGVEGLVWDVIYMAPRQACSDFERAARSYPQIGWNIRSGGDNSWTAPKQSEETKNKRGLYLTGKDHHSYGTHQPKETKTKIGKIHKGKTIPQECRNRISKSMKGRSLLQVHKSNISAARKGIKFSEEHRSKLGVSRRIPVQNLDTGVTFNSLAAASKSINNNQHVSCVCKGKAKTAGGYR